MDQSKTFSVGGKLYAIPADKEQDFIKDMPDAQPVFVFESDGKKLGIPKEKVGEFISDMPDAKPLYDYPELKQQEQPENKLTPDFIKNSTQSVIDSNNPEARLYNGKIDKTSVNFTPEDIDYANTMIPVIQEMKRNINKSLPVRYDLPNQLSGKYGENKAPLGYIDPESVGKGGKSKSRQSVVAGDLLDKTEGYLNAISKGDSNAAMRFVNGLKTVDVANLLSAGISGMNQSIDIYDAAKRYSEGSATDDDKNLLVASSLLQEIQQKAQNDRATSIGTGLADMAPWLVQFSLTGGIGTSATKATASALESLMAKNLMGKVAGNIMKGIAGTAAQTASQVPLMVQGTAERMTDQYQLQDGNLQKTEEGKGFGEALGRTFANNFLEVYSERVFGDSVDKLGTKALSKVLDSKVLANTKVSDIINSIRNNRYVKLTNKTLGLNTPLTENIEEAFTGLTQPFVTEDNLDEAQKQVQEYFSKENLIRVFLTTAAMGAGAGVLQAPGEIYHNAKSDKGKKIVDGFDQEQSDLWNQSLTAETIEERKDAWLNLWNSAAENGATKSELNSMMHYYQTALSEVENSRPTQQPEQTGSQQPYGPGSTDSTPQFTVNPRDTYAAEVRQTIEPFVHQNTGKLTVVSALTQWGEPNKLWFVKVGSENDIDGSVLVEDEQGNQKFLTKEQLSGDPAEMTIDDFVNLKLQEFDTNQQVQQQAQNNQMVYEGRVLNRIPDGSAQTGDGELWLDENGEAVEVPNGVIQAWEKQKQADPSGTPEVVSRVYGKTQVSGTRDQNGNILLSEPMNADQAESLRQEIEKATGGKSTIQAELIPNEDTTLPDSYQLSIVPLSQPATEQGSEQLNLDELTEEQTENNQSVTTPPSQDNKKTEIPAKPLYPLDKDGNPDIEQMDEVQLFNYNAENFGIETAVADLQGDIQLISDKIAKAEKKLATADTKTKIKTRIEIKNLTDQKAKLEGLIPQVAENNNSENVNQEKVSETQQQAIEQQQIVNSKQSESLQKNQLQNEESKKSSPEVDGEQQPISEQGEVTSQEEQGQGVNEGLEENVIEKFRTSKTTYKGNQENWGALIDEGLIGTRRSGEKYFIFKNSSNNTNGIEVSKEIFDHVNSVVNEINNKDNALDVKNTEYFVNNVIGIQNQIVKDGATPELIESLKSIIFEAEQNGITQDQLSKLVLEKNTSNTVPPVVGESFTPGDSAGQLSAEEQRILANNKIVDLVDEYNSLPKNHTNKRRVAFQRIQSGAQQLGYSITDNSGKIEVQANGKKIQRIGTKQTNEDIQAHKALSDYPEEVQSFIQRFLDNPAELFGLDIASTTKQAEQGIKNIREGKKTVAANDVLDSFEKMFNDGVVRIKGSGTNEAHEIPIAEYFAVIDEQLAAIDVEEELNSPSDVDEWMNDEVEKQELEPEQIEELENNIDNDQQENINPGKEAGISQDEGRNESPKPVEEEIPSNQKVAPQGSLFGEEEQKAQPTAEEIRIQQKLDSLTPTQLKEANKGIEEVDKQIKSKLSEIKAIQAEIKAIRKKAKQERGKDKGDLLLQDDVVDSQPLIRQLNAALGKRQREYLDLINRKETIIDTFISAAKAQNEINWGDAGQQELVIPEEEQGKPIGLDNQIEDVLNGQSEQQQQEVEAKIKFVAENEYRIAKINGSPVFDVKVDGDKIRYNLRRKGKLTDQKYYYPIQYADIEYFDKKSTNIVPDGPVKPLLEVLSDGKKEVQEKKAKGITTVYEESNGKVLVYGTKTSQTRLSVEGLSADGIKEELDFEKNRKARAEKEIPEQEEYLRTKMITDVSIAVDEALKANRKTIEITKVTIPWLEKKLAEKQSTPLPEEQQDNPYFKEEASKNNQQKQQDSAYGENNKIVSKERADELRKRLRDKLNNLNSGFDPEVLAIGTELAAYHIEAGARKFSDFSKAMIDDIGEAIKPYLKAIYNGARDLPGMEELEPEMTEYSEVKKANIDELLKPVEEFRHTKTGQILYNVKIDGRSDDYDSMVRVAKKHNPYGVKHPWNSYSKGFLFEKKSDAENFRNEVNGQEKPKFRLIGETGAGNLDKAEEATTRLDNLAVAREMEQAGKDVKSIRLATGWEKGVDGKWRYEVDDSNFVVHLPNDITNGSTFILSDIVLYDELFNAYPDYKNINIIFLEDENFRPNSAQYIHSANTVVFYNFQLRDSEGNVDSANSFKGTLLHEIQHSIQENEGFAVGTSPENAFGNYISQYISRKRGIDGKSKNSLSGITAEEYIEAVNEAKKETRTDSIEDAALELYKRSSGEVESRNVQTRMNMTPEERLNTLLSETEDVAREDQIVLMEGLGVSSLSPFKPSVGKIKAKISEIQAKAPSAAPIVLVETYNNLPDELKDGSTKDSTGIYYKGMVYVIADRITSLDHLIAVWIHENGIHNGLQNVVPGGEFRKLMIKVYDSFIEAGKTNKQYQEIIDFVNENYKDENQAGKGEEFLALLAEKIITKRDLSPMDQSVWKKFLTDFRNWIAKLFNFNSNLLSERQIRNIVRASVQSNFQENEFSSSNQGTSTGTLKRASNNLNGGQGTVIIEPGLYENNAGAGLSDKNRSGGVLSWFGKNESDRSVPLLEILSQAKTTKVQEAETRRITDRLDNSGDSRPKFKREGRLNLDGYLQTASQQYQEKKRERRDLKEVFNGIREFYQDHDLPIRRMEEEIKKLGGRIMDSMKPYRDLNLSYGRMEDLFKSFIDDRMKPILKTISAIAKTGMERESVLPYIICKRATELNPKMREKELQQFIEENPEATDAEIQEKEQEIANKDYSGVTGFDPENNFENPDELAQAIVDEFEAQVPAELIDQLWGNIKYATTDIVKAWQKGQMISEEQAEELIMGSKYYVPLRGWREGAAKQLAYVKGEGFSRSMQHAQGRKSFADNPLAYIHKVAFQAIGEQVDNEVKKSLLNLVAGNYGQEFRHIYELKKAYYVKTILDDGSEGWQLSVDPITGEIIRPSEEMFKNGEATTKIYNQYERLRKPSQAREHEVVVKTATGDMVIVLKGKYLPVAQAMNKRNRMYVSLFTGAIKDASDWTGPAVRTIGNVNNFIKANLTSRNIVFPLTNILRDAPEASLTAFIKGESGTKVIRNMRHASAAFVRDLAGKTDPKNKYDQYLKEFRETGGTTGYTHLKDIEQINKSLDKELNMILRSGFARTINLWHNSLKAINTWSDFFETTTRLAVFISSREAGKTAKESASDAKEYSVNFNRKGKITKALDALYAFFNASVQSLQKNGSLAYRYPKRFSIVAASFMMAGFLEAMLNDWYTDDDDDDDYYNVNEYVRENYLILPFPDGKYVRLPLPPFWRSFKSFGSIIYDTAVKERMTIQQATVKGMANFIASLTPIDLGGLYVDGHFNLSPIAPTILKPWAEVGENRDYMGFTIAKEPFTKEQEKLLAKSGLGKDNVNPAIKFFTDYLAKAGGKDGETKFYRKDGETKELSPLLDFNPSKINHIVQGYLGGTYKFASDIITTATQAVKQDQEVEFNNVPFVNSFIRKTPAAKWRIIEDYYNLKDDNGYLSFDALKREMFKREDKSQFKELATDRYLNEYKAVLDSYDELLSEKMKYMDYKTAEGSEEVIETMKDAINKINKIKQKYNVK